MIVSRSLIGSGALAPPKKSSHTGQKFNIQVEAGLKSRLQVPQEKVKASSDAKDPLKIIFEFFSDFERVFDCLRFGLIGLKF